MQDIRIGLVIMNCPVGCADKNLARMVHWVKLAKKAGAGIVCFPEMNISGYTIRSNAFSAAESIPGPTTARLVKLARQEDMVLLAGMAEIDAQDRMFAAHMVVEPQGIKGIYRKVHLGPPETEHYSNGEAIPLFAVRGVRFGIQLCYDTHFPELSTRMALDRADLIFMPHASPNGTPHGKLTSWMRHLSARAFDNGVFVAACNQTGNNGLGLDFPGVAVVIGPDGNILDQETNGEEALLVADLKAEALERVRGHRMRYFLPNRRPDIYKL